MPSLCVAFCGDILTRVVENVVKMFLKLEHRKQPFILFQPCTWCPFAHCIRSLFCNNSLPVCTFGVCTYMCVYVYMCIVFVRDQRLLDLDFLPEDFRFGCANFFLCRYRIVALDRFLDFSSFRRFKEVVEVVDVLRFDDLSFFFPLFRVVARSCFVA